MGRRPKYSRDGVLTGPAAPAASSADPAPGLEGWPPTYYCYACHTLRWGAEDIRADYCDQCHVFLAELEHAYLRAMSAAAKAVPEA